MTVKLYHPSFTAPMLLAAAVLQACVGGHQAPAVLSVKTPAEAPSSTASSKVISSAAQPEGKHSSVQAPGEQPQILRSREILTMDTKGTPIHYTVTDISVSPSSNAGTMSPASPPCIIPPPLSSISENQSSKHFRWPLQGSSGVHSQFSAAGKRLLYQHEGRPAPLSPIEASLRQPQNLDSYDIQACSNCLEAITKTVSPANAAHIHNALAKAYHRLAKARKGRQESPDFERICKVIRAVQEDITYARKILTDLAPAMPFSYLLSCSGCCQEALQIDFKNASKIVRHYPKMAAALTKAVIVHKTSLLHNEFGILHINATKAEFIADCLTACPAHTQDLLAIIHEAMKVPHNETRIIDVLASFVQKQPSYVEEGIRMLNDAFYSPWSRVRILALSACARIVDASPQCSQHVNKERLCQTFRSIEEVLAGSDAAMKALAEKVLKQINSCEVSFLRETWKRYSRASNPNQP